MKTHDLSAEVSGARQQESRIRTAAAHFVSKLDEDVLKLPMLPKAATEALQVANDPNVGIRSIERVVQADPLIAARVLGVANSAAFGGHQVRTLSQALKRLGTGTIRDVLYQAVSEAHIFRGESGAALARERDHGVAVAHGTQAICRSLGIESTYAFVCGLLHDIGRTVLMELFSTDPPSLTEEELNTLILRLHPLIGSKLARKWSLPSLVSEGCRRHHIYRDWRKQGTYSQIGNIVAAADRIGLHHGVGRRSKRINMMKDRCFFDLGMEPGQVMEIVSQLVSTPVAA